MTVPDCKPHITLHYSIWRLTCACKYKLSFPALITRHVSLVSSVCEIVIGEEHLFRYHRSHITMCLRSMKPATAQFFDRTHRCTDNSSKNKFSCDWRVREPRVLHITSFAAQCIRWLLCNSKMSSRVSTTEKYTSLIILLNNLYSIYRRKNKLK